MGNLNGRVTKLETKFGVNVTDNSPLLLVQREEGAPYVSLAGDAYSAEEVAQLREERRPVKVICGVDVERL